MIRWIPAALTLILVLFGGYLGAKRGFQKSIIRLISLAAATGLFLSLLPLCAEQLLLRLAEAKGIEAETINELSAAYFTRFLPPDSASILAGPAGAVLLTLSIPVLIAVLYWPVHFLSWIIYLTIVAALPPAKRRLWKKSRKNPVGKLCGSILGIASSFFSSIITLLPFIVAGTVIEHTGKEVLPEEYGIREAAACYYDSPLSVFMKQSGIEPFALMLNRTTATVSYESRNYLNQEELIILLPELKAVSDTYVTYTSSNLWNASFISNLHSALTQFYELPYWTDSDKLLLFMDAKNTLLPKLSGIDGFAEQILQHMDYEHFDLLKSDTEIYFECINTFIARENTDQTLSGFQNNLNYETAEQLARNLCRLSDSDTVLPAWINYLTNELTKGKIPKLMDGEVFRFEVVKQEEQNTPASSDSVLPKTSGSSTSKTETYSPDSGDSSFDKNSSFEETAELTVYETYVKPLLKLLFLIETPEKENYSSFRQRVFDTLADLKNNPLIGIWNYTTLHNYSRSRLSLPLEGTSAEN